MQGPPAHAEYQPPGQPVSHEPMHGKERPYGLVLLLYIVTLGIYGLYWHYKTHDELCKQVGRENKDKTLWFVYIGIWAVVFALFIVLAVMLTAAVFGAASAAGSEAEAEEAITEVLTGFVAGAIGLAVAFVIGAIAGLVLFIMYVLRQFNLLQEVSQRTGQNLRLGGGGFMGLYFGGIAVGLIPYIGWVGQIAMQIIAYYMFQENYNEVWRTIRHGRHVPTDAEWAAGGARPSLPHGNAWDAPQGIGSPPGPAAMGGAAAGAPASGFSVGQRAPGAPLARMVRQSFECPRCQAHIGASGEPGAQVDIRCTGCGEGGRVTLPTA